MHSFLAASFNHLTGTFPWLGAAESLRTLLLSHNQFTGFPAGPASPSFVLSAAAASANAGAANAGTGEATQRRAPQQQQQHVGAPVFSSVEVLDLSSNALQGELPNFDNLAELVLLDVSRNANFSITFRGASLNLFADAAASVVSVLLFVAAVASLPDSSPCLTLSWSSRSGPAGLVPGLDAAAARRRHRGPHRRSYNWYTPCVRLVTRRLETTLSGLSDARRAFCFCRAAAGQLPRRSQRHAQQR